MDRKKIRQDYERINKRYEKKYFPKVQKAIKSKISSLIEVVEKNGIEAGKNHLSNDVGNGRLTVVIRDLYQRVGVRHASETERRLRKETLKRFGKNQEWINFINNYLRMFLLEKITFSVNETTRDYLLRVLQEATEKGWSVYDTVNHLDSLPFARYQAARIVRTEVNRAANVGVKAQGETFEYEQNKEWISVHDNRVRGRNPEDKADHLHMDGQVVDFYAKFRDPSNGEELDFPGDKDAPPGETVNCRCQSATIAKRDERGRLIPKKSKITVIRDFNRVQRTVTI
jgi:hypothetical protein